MLRLILVRIGLSVFGLLAVSVVIFWAVELLPGDPAARILGRGASEQAVAQLRTQLGLDQPAAIRYLDWLGGIATGDLGQSLTARRSVADYLARPVANTFTLAAFALVLYLPIVLAGGFATALSRGGLVDGFVSGIVVIGMALPEFVIGIGLVMLFALLLPWFPPLALVDQARGFGDLLSYLFLPAVTLTLAMVAYAIFAMRDRLIEALDAEHVRMARLRGLRPARVLLAHALPQALGPVINVTALNVAWLIGGIVVVETVFNFPGLGRVLVDAVRFHDVPVIEAAALILSAVYILANLLADLSLALLDPRLRARA